jgi:hypothetical protein
LHTAIVADASANANVNANANATANVNSGSVNADANEIEEEVAENNLKFIAMNVRLYGCLQSLMKMHSLFDLAIIKVI